ncbi:MAG: hypothetical protein R6V56_03045 [Lentisphaeria bacterium]
MSNIDRKRKRISSDYTNFIWYIMFPFFALFNCVAIALVLFGGCDNGIELGVGITFAFVLAPAGILFIFNLKTVYWRGEEVNTYDIRGRHKKWSTRSLKVVYFPTGYYGFGAQPIILKSKDDGFLIFLERGHAPSTDAHPYVKEFRREIGQ